MTTDDQVIYDAGYDYRDSWPGRPVRHGVRALRIAGDTEVQIDLGGPRGGIFDSRAELERFRAWIDTTLTTAADAAWPTTETGDR